MANLPNRLPPAGGVTTYRSLPYKSPFTSVPPPPPAPPNNPLLVDNTSIKIANFGFNTDGNTINSFFPTGVQVAQYQVPENMELITISIALSAVNPSTGPIFVMVSRGNQVAINLANLIDGYVDVTIMGNASGGINGQTIPVFARGEHTYLIKGGGYTPKLSQGDFITAYACAPIDSNCVFSGMVNINYKPLL